LAAVVMMRGLGSRCACPVDAARGAPAAARAGEMAKIGSCLVASEGVAG
jgi:hypothetical protein